MAQAKKDIADSRYSNFQENFMAMKHRNSDIPEQLTFSRDSNPPAPENFVKMKSSRRIESRQ